MLQRRKKYLQIALNSTLDETARIISTLPPSDRIIIEAGTPLIKRYGQEAISYLYSLWQQKIAYNNIYPYIVADLKTMDRGNTEVEIAKSAGASAAIALGQAPIETINTFIDSCKKTGLDSMLDMMNIESPVKVLRMTYPQLRLWVSIYNLNKVPCAATVF